MKKLLSIIGILVLILFSSYYILTNPKVKRGDLYLYGYVLVNDVESITIRRDPFSSSLYLSNTKEGMIEILKALDICNAKFTYSDTFDQDNLLSQEGCLYITVEKGDNVTHYVIFYNGALAEINYEENIISYTDSGVGDYDAIQYIIK